MVKRRRVRVKAEKDVRRARPKKVRIGKKKPAAKVRIAKKAKRISQIAPQVALEKVGEVTHYFPKVKAAAVLILKDGLKLGDEVYIKGHTTDFKEKVGSMQLDHIPIQEGKKGQEIGLLVKSRVRIGDSVYKL